MTELESLALLIADLNSQLRAEQTRATALENQNRALADELREATAKRLEAEAELEDQATHNT